MRLVLSDLSLDLSHRTPFHLGDSCLSSVSGTKCIWDFAFRKCNSLSVYGVCVRGVFTGCVYELVRYIV